MTRHGTSAVIKQTNDGLGSAEMRLLKMLQVVARDQKNQEKEVKTTSIHPFSKQVIWFRICGAGAYPTIHWSTR